MDKELKDQSLDEIASQLSHPTGEAGITMAEMMNETNMGMIVESIDNLNLRDRFKVLELGPGNGAHLTKILGLAKNLDYYGLELSETMVKEANRINSAYLQDNKIEFKLYEGKVIPYEANSFERMMTVNTIYFWPDPLATLAEAFRVLKSDGLFIITFGQKKFMQQLPFVNHKFKLYSNEDISKLVELSDFQLADTLDKKETFIGKFGESMQRDYSLAILKKPAQ